MLHLSPITAPYVFCTGTTPYLGDIMLNAYGVYHLLAHVSSLSYTLSAVTTDNGKNSDIFVISGPKSMLSCLVRARLIKCTNYLL